MNLVRAMNVTVSFAASHDPSLPVFENFSLTVDTSEFVGILGPNGCGKTTLLRVLAGLLVPTSGTVTISERPAWETLCGYVPQDYRLSLFPWLRVVDNIAFGLRLRGGTRNDARTKAEEFSTRVAPTLPLHRYPYELSGGQQQLVTLLRAFLFRPGVLLLDEPFGSLDRHVRRTSRSNLLRLWQETRPTTVLVSHDPEDLLALCNRILVLGGRPAKVVMDFESISKTTEETAILRAKLEAILEEDSV